MKISRKELRLIIESVLKEENSDAGVVVEKANGLEYCAGRIKKYVKSKEPNKKEISLSELNGMLDFYLFEGTGLISVVEKDHSGPSEGEKFELSAEKGHHNSLNYHPMGLDMPPKVVE